MTDSERRAVFENVINGLDSKIGKAAGHGCIVGEGCHVHSVNERGAAPNIAIRNQFFCLSHERSLSVKTQFSVTTVQYSTTAEEITESNTFRLHIFGAGQ